MFSLELQQAVAAGRRRCVSLGSGAFAIGLHIYPGFMIGFEAALRLTFHSNDFAASLGVALKSAPSSQGDFASESTC